MANLYLKKKKILSIVTLNLLQLKKVQRSINPRITKNLSKNNIKNKHFQRFVFFKFPHPSGKRRTDSNPYHHIHLLSVVVFLQVIAVVTCTGLTAFLMRLQIRTSRNFWHKNKNFCWFYTQRVRFLFFFKYHLTNVFPVQID